MKSKQARAKPWKANKQRLEKSLGEVIVIYITYILYMSKSDGDDEETDDDCYSLLYQIISITSTYY